MFFKIESWKYQHLFEISTHSAYSDNCYFYFSYCLSDWVEILWGFRKFFFKQVLKVSAFHLGKKNFVPKKEILSCCQYQNKKALFTDQIFSEGFDYELQIARVRKQRLLKRASVRATFCSLFVAKRLWFMFKLLNWLLYMLYCYLFVLF